MNHQYHHRQSQSPTRSRLLRGRLGRAAQTQRQPYRPKQRLREIAARDHPDGQFVLQIEAGVSDNVPIAERPGGRKMVAALRPGDNIVAIARPAVPQYS